MECVKRNSQSRATKDKCNEKQQYCWILLLYTEGEGGEEFNLEFN